MWTVHQFKAPFRASSTHPHGPAERSFSRQSLASALIQFDSTSERLNCNHAVLGTNSLDVGPRPGNRLIERWLCLQLPSSPPRQRHLLVGPRTTERTTASREPTGRSCHRAQRLRWSRWSTYVLCLFNAKCYTPINLLIIHTDSFPTVLQITINLYRSHIIPCTTVGASQVGVPR